MVMCMVLCQSGRRQCGLQAFGDGILAGITRDYSDFANKNGITVIPDPAGRRDYLGLFGIIWRVEDFSSG